MKRRSVLVIALSAGLLSALSGCANSPGTAAAGPSASPSAPTATAAQNRAADRLRAALLTDVAGYRRAGDPDSGAYGSLKAIQNFNQLQRQVTLDKPGCAGAAGGVSGAALRSAPAAIAGFAKDDGQTLTETLIAVSTATAEAQIRKRVPTGCRSFRAQVGGQWSTHEVTEATGAPLGEGSRTVGVGTVSGSAQVATWYVVVRSRTFLVTITLYGPAVTQADAEDLARQAYTRATQTLR